MAKLIYTVIASVDGYISDENGNFDWAAPDPEVHAFVNDLERSAGTYLYGRRLYETMRVWEHPDQLGDDSPEVLDYSAIWRAADKIVYSSTLAEVSTERTRIERDFDPATVRQMKETADSDLTIGGPNLASHALRAGLVDECCLLLAPAVVGGGTPVFPDKVGLRLELLDERRFAGGMVFLRYRVNRPPTSS